MKRKHFEIVLGIMLVCLLFGLGWTSADKIQKQREYCYSAGYTSYEWSIDNSSCSNNQVDFTYLEWKKRERENAGKP